jgi:D-alanyl-D-alanine carboxypeptidase
MSPVGCGGPSGDGRFDEGRCIISNVEPLGTDRSLGHDVRRRTLAFVSALAIVVVAMGAAVAPVDAAAALPKCRIADKITKFHTRADWDRSLLDTTYRLPKTYRPVGMISVRSAGLPGGGSIRRVALKDLRALVRASRKAGVRLAAESTYRSYSTQVWTFAHWANIGGIAAALESSARPGHSEHQLGTAIDFKTIGGWAPWASDWGKTREGAWLKKNSWRYGFVMSYPAGKKAVTCYRYEPWHYRYVGKELAKRVHDSGKTLRQILWQLQTEPPTPTPTPTPTPEPTPTPTPTGTPEPTPTETPPGP